MADNRESSCGESLFKLGLAIFIIVLCSVWAHHVANQPIHVYGAVNTYVSK